MTDPFSLPEPELVTRKDWGAKEPKDAFDMINFPVEFIWFIYDTNSAACNSLEECKASMRDLQDHFLQQQRFSDLPFSFLIGGDGRVYEGRGWYADTPLIRSWPQMNCNKFEIGYLGRHKKEEIPPQLRQVCRQLIMYGLNRYLLSHKYYPCEFKMAGLPLNADGWLRPDMSEVEKEFFM